VHVSHQLGGKVVEARRCEIAEYLDVLEGAISSVFAGVRVAYLDAERGPVGNMAPDI
jgi:hypothetical protein